MLSPHHRRIFPLSFNEQESSFSPSRKPFFDSIDPKPPFARCVDVKGSMFSSV
jgi:hypothetical protein